jgi:hypothetical protein
VGAGILIFLGAAFLAESFVDLSLWVWTILLSVAGLGTFVAYLSDPSLRGLLLLAYLLCAFALYVALVGVRVLRGRTLFTYALWACVPIFISVFLRKRTRRWALIVSYVLAAVGLMIALIGFAILRDLQIPAFLLLAPAIPFLAIPVYDRRQWWALVLGGLCALGGIALLVTTAAFSFMVPVALVVAGALVAVYWFARGNRG